MAKTSTKLTDSNEKISAGGRAQRFWANKPVKKVERYDADQYKGKLDQFEIIKKYKLKGFEYGNWVNNNDRFDFLQAAAESLEEVSKILHTKNNGCDGTVGIAFGARGMSGAKAHFEPGSFMINLTKENGYNSLAHEYGHALDYLFGMFVDQSREYTSLVGGRSEKRIITGDGGELRTMANNVVNAITTNNGAQTDTYKSLVSLYGDKGGYWFRRNEIFARAFEQWMQYRLAEKKIKNTFLTKNKYDNGNYMTKQDFKRVLPLMDKLIKEMGTFMNNKKKSISINTAKRNIAAKK
ncbi:MAG: LPD1 domain-containing protein [Paludibacter sp.]